MFSTGVTIERERERERERETERVVEAPSSPKTSIKHQENDPRSKDVPNKRKNFLSTGEPFFLIATMSC